MKNIFFYFLFLSLSAHGQWIELDTGIEASYFSDVYAISTDVAVVVGSNGIIIKTTDGGETWEQKDSGTTDELLKIEYPTQEIGYIIGGNGTLLKTTNGGETWVILDVENVESFYDLSCVDEDIVYISTSGGLIKSEDGGMNWTEPVDLPFYEQIQFFANGIGFAGNSFWTNNENEFAVTSNDGDSWQNIDALSPFHFIHSNLGFYYGNQLNIITFNGESQIVSDYINELGVPSLSHIYAISENTVWGLLYWETLDGANPFRGIVKFSKEGDNNYSINNYFMNNQQLVLNSIHFANETTGYCVGLKGRSANLQSVVLKNSTGINEGLNVNEVDASINIKVYPNPTSSELNIDLSGISGNNVVVSLIDVTGKQIFSKSFMQKQIKINTRQFAKGTYILQVKVNDKNYTQKVIIN